MRMHALLNTSHRGLLAAFAKPHDDDPLPLVRELNTELNKFIANNSSRVDALQAAVDELNRGRASSAIGGGGGGPELQRARAATVEFLRTGSVQPGSVAGGAPNAAMTTQSNPDGGYLVPAEIDATIDSLLLPLSPMRRLATIVRVTSGEYHKLINKRGATSGWVGEEESRPETGTPQLADIEPPIGEIYAMPSLTQRMLDDGGFNLDQWIGENVIDEFSLQEGTAFTNGIGGKKPLGFMALPTASTGDAVRAFGTLQYVPSGTSATLGTAPADILIDLMSSLKPAYRAGEGVAWQMNSTTLSVVRKLKDGQGNYLWQPSLQKGQPETILGYPVEVNEDMPDIGANAFPIAFGNWRRGYIIIDRMETRILRDPYTKKGWVNFYITKRVGGSPTNTNAIKLLKCATS